MFGIMKPYAPPPPPGVQPPPLWGKEEHVLDLLGDRVYFKNHYGPTIATYRNLAEQPDRAAALDRELAELGDRHDLRCGAMD
jgi:hypothetical protein